MDFDAIIGAIIPPSLCPINPSFEIFRSFLDFKYVIAASVSLDKSLEVAVAYSPSDFPTPLSSYRNTAIPWRVKKSEINRNGLWPIISSFLFWGPLPLIKMTTGNFSRPSGVVKVPAKLISSDSL